MEKRLMKLRYFIITVIFVLILCAGLFIKLPVKIIYNPTGSAPKGYYLIMNTMIRKGDYVFSDIPVQAKKMAAKRQYLPMDVPILKPVAARPRDHICIRKGHVFINGKPVADLLERDSSDRILAPWIGCRSLFKNEYFLLSTYTTHSFDSRYFGPVTRKMIIGKAVPIWILESKK